MMKNKFTNKEYEMDMVEQRHTAQIDAVISRFIYIVSHFNALRIFHNSEAHHALESYILRLYAETDIDMKVAFEQLDENWGIFSDDLDTNKISQIVHNLRMIKLFLLDEKNKERVYNQTVLKYITRQINLLEQQIKHEIKNKDYDEK